MSEQSKNPINFDGQVAVVTGAGAGIGRAYALEFARRGAKVVVNDLKGSAEVVKEIEAAGGEAMPFDASVADESAMQELASSALERWGRIDIFVANAGILIDRSFAKMEISDFRKVLDVHLLGSVCGIKAVWPAMMEQKYGRIVVTTSVAGLWGNFGQANYSSAKMALVGLMNTLQIEGQRHGIRINTIAPGASTQMTDALIPDALKPAMAPERVAPAVVALCSENAPDGVILNAEAGRFSVAQLMETQGVQLAQDCSAEDVIAAWDDIANPAELRSFTSATDRGAIIMKSLS